MSLVTWLFQMKWVNWGGGHCDWPIPKRGCLIGGGLWHTLINWGGRIQRIQKTMASDKKGLSNWGGIFNPVSTLIMMVSTLNQHEMYQHGILVEDALHCMAACLHSTVMTKVMVTPMLRPATPALSVTRLWDVGCLRFGVQLQVKICENPLVSVALSLWWSGFLKWVVRSFIPSLKKHTGCGMFLPCFSGFKSECSNNWHKTWVPSPADGFCSKRMAGVIGSSIEPLKFCLAAGVELSGSACDGTSNVRNATGTLEAVSMLNVGEKKSFRNL